MMELFRVMFRMNAESREVTALKAVASSANQLLQFGMRIWIHRLQSTSKLRNQGTFWSLRSITARHRSKHSGHHFTIVPCTIDGPRPNSKSVFFIVTRSATEGSRSSAVWLWYGSDELAKEVWTKDVDRIRNEQPKNSREKPEEITRIGSLTKMVEELRKQVSELENQFAKVTLRLDAYNSVRSATERHVAEGRRSSMKPRPTDFACWSCGSPDNSVLCCPNKKPVERRHNESWRVRHVREKRTRNCTRSRYKKQRSGNLHGIAEGLSRRSDATKPDSESLPKVNAIDRINEDS